MKKILVLCDFGQVRSVAMATVLRERGYFAVAGTFDSWRKAKFDFLKMQFAVSDIVKTSEMLIWDEVIYMQKGGEHYIGEDVWGDCENPELIMKCCELANKLGLIGDE